ncbi:DUF3226 domain-containing protein [Okeania sp.]|uniref:DUF3226 domain-containing protein n=1 Tax=Okeania sp. TaxID=3100323 RepID=UPI002B4B5531|nr:DUF3226 domain-containing protein [Okeania sp.]MEB3340823.1 DUF3226 domain-containing protein [Okeania sp.]
MRSLLITRDADELFNNASQSIDGFIKLIKDRKNLTIKTYIFADNKSAGMLYYLCLKAIDSYEMSCIEDFFQCINKNTNREPNEFSKAKIYAWLSTQTKPDKRLDEVAKAGYIDCNNEKFNELINFIKSL